MATAVTAWRGIPSPLHHRHPYLHIEHVGAADHRVVGLGDVLAHRAEQGGFEVLLAVSKRIFVALKGVWKEMRAGWGGGGDGVGVSVLKDDVNRRVEVGSVLRCACGGGSINHLPHHLTAILRRRSHIPVDAAPPLDPPAAGRPSRASHCPLTPAGSGLTLDLHLALVRTLTLALILALALVLALVFLRIVGKVRSSEHHPPGVDIVRVGLILLVG